MTPLRVAIIGAGKVAHLYARALASLDEGELVAAVGRSMEKTLAFASEYGAAAFTDTPTMLDQARPDVVIICTPHPVHAGPAAAALERGVHALIEKPMAASLADCDAMIAAAERGGATLGMVSQRRFYEPSKRVKAALEAGKLGKPILGTVMMLGWRSEEYYRSDPWRGQWLAEGGGVLVNQAPHQLDLLLWWLGEIDEVYGVHANLNHPTIEVEDTAVAVIRFKNGALGSLVVSNSQNPGLYGQVHVHGSNGASVGVQTESGSMFIAGMTSVQEAPINDLWTVAGEAHLLAEWQAQDRARFAQDDPAQFYIRAQTHDFLRAVLDARLPAITGADGRAVVELFTAIYRSQRDGRPVRFPLPTDDGRGDFDGRLAK